jgi:hypothetical protein
VSPSSDIIRSSIPQDIVEGIIRRYVLAQPPLIVDTDHNSELNLVVALILGDFWDDDWVKRVVHGSRILHEGNGIHVSALLEPELLVRLVIVDANGPHCRRRRYGGEEFRDLDWYRRARCSPCGRWTGEVRETKTLVDRVFGARATDKVVWCAASARTHTGLHSCQ